jgi:hypothetical protein
VVAQLFLVSAILEGFERSVEHSDAAKVASNFDFLLHSNEEEPECCEADAFDL